MLMQKLLEDPTNLELLNLLVSGEGVELNISQLAKMLNKHRKTIKDRANRLFEKNIINKPQYAFPYLFKEFPLMVISKTNFLRDENTRRFIENDNHIFAAFFFKEEEYNTLMISFHKDVCSHVKWRDYCIKNEIVPKRQGGYPSEVLYLGGRCFEKFDPSTSARIIEEKLENRPRKSIKGIDLDDLSYRILINLLKGIGLRTNENLLSKKLNIHRRTVERRIKILQKERIIGRPVCFFPRLIAPPGYILVKSLMQIKNNEEEVIKKLKNDSHVTWLIKGITGKGGYNIVLFSIFEKIEEHIAWQEEISKKYHNEIGALKNTYLSPKMTFSIDPEFVSIQIIKNKLEEIKKK